MGNGEGLANGGNKADWDGLRRRLAFRFVEVTKDIEWGLD